MSDDSPDDLVARAATDRATARKAAPVFDKVIVALANQKVAVVVEVLSAIMAKVASDVDPLAAHDLIGVMSDKARAKVELFRPTPRVIHG
jgi:hypothetical protein